MREFFYWAGAALSLFGILSIVIYYFWMNSNPQRIREFHQSSQYSYMRSDRLTGIVCFGAAICIMFIIGGGIYQLLYWIPSSWGSADTHGSWTSARSLISWLFGFYGGMILVSIIDNHTAVLAERQLVKQRELEELLMRAQENS